MCLGTEYEKEDIFPCTWFAVNVSCEAKIFNGSFWCGDTRIARLSEARPYKINETDEERARVENNVFNMEPGRTLFISLRVCDKAFNCGWKKVGTIIIKSEGSTFARSQNGEAIDVVVVMSTEDSSRRKRSLSAPNVEITTPSGE